MLGLMRSVGLGLLLVAAGAAWVLYPYGSSRVEGFWWLANTLAICIVYATARRLGLGSFVIWGAAASVAAALGALGWWNRWMYAGWPGTPHLLHRVIWVDGEASYDATRIEMFLMLFVAFGAAVTVRALTLRWSGRAQSRAPLI